MDPPLNKKEYIVYVDISGFTGKPVKLEGFNDPRGVWQMVMYLKTMFDRYYFIKSFCHLKTLEKRFEKFFFVLL